jgi:hypothetical protein
LATLKEDEKKCKNCGTPFSGNEEVWVADDGYIKVKHIICGCGTILVLDVLYSQEND